jgi:hypothetical protein
VGDLLIAAGRRAAEGIDRLLHRPPGRSARALHALLYQVAAVRPRCADWPIVSLFALANWIFDFGCLAASAAALGLPGLSVSLLLLTYTTGMATSSLSLLPAGIGIVDGAMVLVLTAGGVPPAMALPIVLLYRLISVGVVVFAGWCIAAWRPFVGHIPDLRSSGTHLGSRSRVAPGCKSSRTPSVERLTACPNAHGQHMRDKALGQRVAGG